MFVDSGFIIIEEFTSTKLENWSFDISSLHSDLRCNGQLFHVKQYIEETERTQGKQFKEHTDGNHPSSAVQEHIDLTGHPVTLDLVKMLCKDDNKTRRRVKEAIEVNKDGPTLNKDHGHEIPPILLQFVSHDLPGHVEWLAITPCDQVTAKW